MYKYLKVKNGNVVEVNDAGNPGMTYRDWAVRLDVAQFGRTSLSITNAVHYKLFLNKLSLS